MPDPPALHAWSPRTRADCLAAACAVQANVAALRVAWCRTTGHRPDMLEISTPAPGPVRQMREILLDRRGVKDFSIDELAIRLRQVWGEFSALCWLFHHADPNDPPRWGDLPPDGPMRCPGHLLGKIREVEAGLWRIRHERFIRRFPSSLSDPDTRAAHEIALTRPLRLGGVEIGLCSDADLLCYGCEYAGMLAGLRWSADERWAWEGPSIMEVVLPADFGAADR